MCRTRTALHPRKTGGRAPRWYAAVVGAWSAGEKDVLTLQRRSFVFNINVQFVSSMSYNIRHCANWLWAIDPARLSLEHNVSIADNPKGYSTDRMRKRHDMSDGNLQGRLFSWDRGVQFRNLPPSSLSPHSYTTSTTSPRLPLPPERRRFRTSEQDR